MFRRNRAFLLASTAVLPFYFQMAHSPGSDEAAGNRRHRAAPRPSGGASAATLDGDAGLFRQGQEFNAARENLLPKVGVSTYNFTRDNITAQPQGASAPLEKIILQAPGVTQDSAAGGTLHVRNEHANLQYRINGILLPDGIAGFGQVIDTGFVGSMSLVTGALPAQYGLRTSGSSTSRRARKPNRKAASVSMAAARKPSSPVLNMAARRAKPNTSCPGVICKTTRHRKSDTEHQSDSRQHAAGQRLRLSVVVPR